MTRLLEVEHHYIALVEAITTTVADSASEHSGESVFAIEVALLERLEAELPRMISAAKEALMLSQSDDSG
jgi:hypothetical protein